MPEAITADGKSQRPPDRERHWLSAEIASGARRGSKNPEVMVERLDVLVGTPMELETSWSVVWIISGKITVFTSGFAWDFREVWENPPN